MDSRLVSAASPAEAPIVSVIIVSWNARRYLEQCLRSLTGEACRYSMEIIVVDNQSSDDSVECVRQQFPHVRLICNDTNAGFAKANNLGIAHSRGQYLCLVNSDVEVLPGCITSLVDYCESRLDVGIVGPHVTGGDGHLQPSCRILPSLRTSLFRAFALDTLFPRSRFFAAYPMTWWNYGDTREVDVLSGCFWFIRRTSLEIVGGLDSQFFMYGEDIDFCRRFHQAGCKVVFNSEAKIIHYGGASSANAPAKFAVELERAFLQYFLKHDGKLKTSIHFAMALILHLNRLVGNTVLWLLFPKTRSLRLQKIRSSAACINWLVKSGAAGRFLRQPKYSASFPTKSGVISAASSILLLLSLMLF